MKEDWPPFLFLVSILALSGIVSFLTTRTVIKTSDVTHMSATHSYAWRDESLAEVAMKTEIAGQVVAALAAKQQMQPLDDKERATYQLCLDYLMGSFKK